MTDKKSHWLVDGIKRKQLRKERRNALRKADKKLGIKIRDTDYTPYDFCGSICPVCEELINRQKAEIERLKSEIGKEFTCFVGDPHKVEHCPYLDEIEIAKTEAIKEFAEQLKEKAWIGMWETISHVDVDDIDNLVKEMTEKEPKL